MISRYWGRGGVVLDRSKMGAEFNCLIREEQGRKGATGELYLTWPTVEHLGFNSFAQFLQLKSSTGC